MTTRREVLEMAGGIVASATVAVPNEADSYEGAAGFHLYDAHASHVMALLSLSGIPWRFETGLGMYLSVPKEFVQHAGQMIKKDSRRRGYTYYVRDNGRWIWSRFKSECRRITFGVQVGWIDEKSCEVPVPKVDALMTAIRGHYPSDTWLEILLCRDTQVISVGDPPGRTSAAIRSITEVGAITREGKEGHGLELFQIDEGVHHIGTRSVKGLKSLDEFGIRGY